MEEKKNRKIWKIFLLAAICISAVMVAGYMLYISYSNGADILAYNGNIGAGSKLSIESDSVIRESFTSEADKIRGMRLQFQYEEEFANSGEVDVLFCDGQTGEVIFQNTVSVSSLVNGEPTYFDFDTRISGCKGREFALTLSFKNILPETELKMWCLDCDDASAVCTKDNVATEYDINLRLITAGMSNLLKVQVVIYGILIIAVVFTASAFLFNFVSLKNIHRVYIVAGLLVGLAFSLMSLTMVAPDEPVHLYKAYSLSNRVMGVESGENGAIKMRSCDAQWDFKIVGINKEYYNDYYEGFLDKPENKELTDTSQYPIYSYSFLYTFSALGMTVGRILGLGTVFMYLFGRLFNMIFFVLVTGYAIKKMPFAKTLIFVWAMLPITLQQACSYSYDCMINAMAVLIIALTFHFLYDEGKAKKHELAVLILACLLLAVAKGHAFLPISLAPLLIVFKLIHDRKQEIKDRWIKLDKKIRLAVYAGTGLIVILVCLFGLKTLISIKNANEPAYVSWSGEQAYSLGYILNNPGALVKLVCNTLWSGANNYIVEMFGGWLGWLEINIMPIITIGFMFLAVFASMRREDEEQKLPVGHKVWYVLLVLMSCGFIFMGMLVSWTPITLGYVDGIQGRYFLPMFVLVFACLRTKKACLGRNADKVVSLLAVYLQLFVTTSYFFSIG